MVVTTPVMGIKVTVTKLPKSRRKVQARAQCRPRFSDSRHGQLPLPLRRTRARASRARRQRHPMAAQRPSMRALLLRLARCSAARPAVAQAKPYLTPLPHALTPRALSAPCPAV